MDPASSSSTTCSSSISRSAFGPGDRWQFDFARAEGATDLQDAVAGERRAQFAAAFVAEDPCLALIFDRDTPGLGPVTADVAVGDVDEVRLAQAGDCEIGIPERRGVLVLAVWIDVMVAFVVGGDNGRMVVIRQRESPHRPNILSWRDLRLACRIRRFVRVARADVARSCGPPTSAFCVTTSLTRAWQRSGR